MVTDEVPATTDTLPETVAPDHVTDAAEAETAAAATAVEDPAAVPEAEAPSPPAEPEAEPAPPEKPDNKHWYIVKVQSGREETIKEAILRKVKIEGLEEYFGEIYIPTEKVTEMRKSKRYTREKKTLPGYIMAQVEFNDRILYLFRETSGVGDFVGGTTTKPPSPMSPSEVDRWLKRKKEGEPETAAAVHHDFDKGDRVKVKDGMFKEMEGEVKEILEAKNQVKVELTIFGRPVDVEMEYWQVEKA